MGDYSAQCGPWIVPDKDENWRRRTIVQLREPCIDVGHILGSFAVEQIELVKAAAWRWQKAVKNRKQPVATKSSLTLV